MKTAAWRFRTGTRSLARSSKLRAEMNVLTIVNTCPHPLDPSPRYEPKPVHIAVKRVTAPAADDPCRVSRPENGRGFTLTERYFL